MRKEPFAIHQFHSGSAYGDAITNGMCFIQEILHDFGFESNIYVEHIAPEYKDKLVHYKDYKTNKNNILLVHHSIGHNCENWLKNLEDRKILVYHNITPTKFFSPYSELYRYSKIGRDQLYKFKEMMEGAIADSEINYRELKKIGYKNIETIPLLINIEKIIYSNWNHSLFDKLCNTYNILFVGRLIENKFQHELIEIFSIFQEINPIDSKLILVGGYDQNSEYFKKILQIISDKNLNNEVLITGKVPEADLYAYYRGSDVFVCMSEHEGFCVPILEAMVFDLPVIAYDSPLSNVKNTLNNSGILIKEKKFDLIAAFISLLVKNRGLRKKIIEKQRGALERYYPDKLKSQFKNFLNSIGVQIDAHYIETPKITNEIKYQIEGPFDSSYSLALINREMALSLDKIYTGQISLYSTEGPGDFLPNRNFIQNNPEIKKLWEKSKKCLNAEVVTRLLYPPRVSGMRGLFNLLLCYAWEESGFPNEYVENFNRHLDGITTLSEYTKKVLVDNGVKVPIFVIGAGVDHILKVEEKEYPGYLGKGFKFLHISSCFPRKGVDLLLKAYAEAFTDRDEVTLIIKTFSNIHNNIEKEVKDLKKKYRRLPEIIIIKEDLEQGYIINLYKKCDALVLPTRGEGFALPAAESSLFNKPVIITSYSGHMDFCNESTAWLVDFEFEKAKTHIGVPDSVWANPKCEDLAKTMKELVKLRREEILKKTQKAKSFLLNNFKWSDCAKRLESAVEKIKKLPIIKTNKIKVGWLSTWNTKCGIATYSKFLIDNLIKDNINIKIFAPIEGQRIKDDEEFVIRCWETYARGYSIKKLTDYILKEQIEVLIIQFNFGFFEIFSFGKMLEFLKENGIKIIIIFHSTTDVDKPDIKASLGWISESLKKVERLFLHSINDLNRLKNFGLIDNITLFPHGVIDIPEGDKKIIESKLGLFGKRIISSFGFLLPQKGIPELITAFSEIQKEYKNLHLLLLNALFPNPASEELRDKCLNLIQKLDITSKVTMINDFLEDDDVLSYLKCSDIIVFPYQKTAESSSSAVRYGIASQRPVLCTPCDIFHDVEDIVYFTPDNSIHGIIKGIKYLLDHPDELNIKHEFQVKWVKNHSWESLGKRLSRIIESLYINY